MQSSTATFNAYKVSWHLYAVFLSMIVVAACDQARPTGQPATRQLEYNDHYEATTGEERRCRDLALETKLSLRTASAPGYPKITTFCSSCGELLPQLCEFLILDTLARNAYADGALDSAQVLFARQAAIPALAAGSNPLDSRYRFMALDQLYTYHNNKTDYESALAAGQQILAEASEANDSLFIMYGYKRIGTSINALGKPEVAAGYLDTANDITLRHGTPIARASLYLDLSQSDLKDSELLVRYGHKARTLIASSAPNYIWWAYGSLARAHVIAEQYDSARHFAALVLDQPRVEPQLAVMAYRSLYHVAVAEEAFVEANLYLDSLQASMDGIGNAEQIDLYIDRARLAEELGDSTKAHADYRRAARLSMEDSTITESTRVVYSGLLSTARFANRPLSARTLYRATQVQDTMLQRMRRSTVSRLQEEFDDELRQAEIGNLNEVRIAQATTLRNRNYALAGGSLALLLLTGGGLALYRQRNTLARANARVTTLNRELNHRAAAQISLAYQLIRNQQYNLRDETARSALDDSESQLRALQIVNQRLARSASDRVRADEVLTEVANNLQAASPQPFTLSLDLPPLELPAEQVTKVALVVNELVTNSIKYAFADSRVPSGATPTVQLSLKRTGNTTHLTYADNGPGKDGTVRGTGAGTELVEAMLEDLEAEVREDSARGYRMEAQWG